jgi:hypothetical protein
MLLCAHTTAGTRHTNAALAIALLKYVSSHRTPPVENGVLMERWRILLVVKCGYCRARHHMCQWELIDFWIAATVMSAR